MVKYGLQASDDSPDARKQSPWSYNASHWFSHTFNRGKQRRFKETRELQDRRPVTSTDRVPLPGCSMLSRDQFDAKDRARTVTFSVPQVRSAAGWAAWLGGSKVGQGVFGTAFKVPVTPRSIETFRAMYACMRHTVFTSIPLRGAVVVKVQIPDGSDRRRWIHDNNYAESCIHRHLASTKSAVRLPGFQRSLAASEYVPRFYFSGVVLNAYNGKEYIVTVMDHVEGKPLHSFRKPGMVSADLYLRFERAAASLWASGVVHGDLHGNNVMYDPKSKKLTILDFGRTVLLPPAMVSLVRQKMAHAISAGVHSLGELFSTSDTHKHRVPNLQHLVNRKVFNSYRLSWYHSDASPIRGMYNSLPRAEKAVVARERRALWGLSSIESLLSEALRLARDNE